MFEQIKLPYGFDALEPHIDTNYGDSLQYATYTNRQ